MKKIYTAFDAKSKEAFNFAQLAAVLARKQEFLLPLRFDYNGADALAFNPSTNQTRSIQLKARITIQKKYVDKNLWIAFPHWTSENSQDWYLLLHDELVNIWGPEKLNGPDEGRFAANPSVRMLQSLVPYMVGSITFS